MPKLQTYEIYLMPAAGATKTFVSTDVIDVYELNATGGAIVLAADMEFQHSGTPNVASEFKFQYGGGVTQNLALGRSVSFFGTDLTDAQALQQMVITAFWNGLAWEITLLKSVDGDLSSVGTFGSTPNAEALTVTSGVLNMQPASALFGGGVSTATQTFAGAKTFNVLSGNLLIDSLGLGIGVAPTARRYINSTKTFDNPLPINTSDIMLQTDAVFTYTGANDSASGCGSGLFLSKATGAFTPSVISGCVSHTSNNMSTNLSKSIATRSSHNSGGSGNAITDFNAGFASALFSNKLGAGETTLVTTNHDFISTVPYQNNVVSGAITVTNQFGFYAENYKGANKVPTISNIATNIKISATITNAWQFYADGTSALDIGSYIGNRLGVGFATAPTTLSEVTALLHIGAGTLDSAQIRLIDSAVPAAPNDGDIWFTGAALFIRIAGVTRTVTVV